MRFDLRSSLKAVSVGAYLGLFSSPNQAEAGDAKAGRAKGGIRLQRLPRRRWPGENPEAPNLAGQSENYLIEQITAFKSGSERTK